MTYYEGILVSSGESINSAAIGAEIEDSTLGCQIYRPSDTARNLNEGSRFTFSLTDDPLLFFKGALTGHDSPTEEEIEPEDLEEKDGFYHPEEANRVYFCEVKKFGEMSQEDEYGEAKIKLVEAEVLDVEGEDDHIGRDDPLVDAMVHATRMYVADEAQREELEKKIREVLSDIDSRLKDRIIRFVKEMR